jgi:hypothetical protein
MPGGRRFRYISAASSGTHACGIDDAGRAYCWGEAGAVPRRPACACLRPCAGFPVSFIIHGIQRRREPKKTAGSPNWGYDYVLGRGDVVSSATRVEVAGGVRFKTLSVARAHACGIEAATGAAFCWGRGDLGALGWGRAVSSPVARKVAGNHVFTTIASAMAYTCALDADGRPWCW